MQLLHEHAKILLCTLFRATDKASREDCIAVNLLNRIKKWLTPSADPVTGIKPKDKANVRQQCVVIFTKLAAMQERGSYQPALAQGTWIKVPTHLANVELYIKHLKLLNSIVADGKALEVDKCSYSMHDLSVDHFFVSADKRYIPTSKMKDLIECSLALLEHCKAGDIAQFGVDEHNSRLLKPLFQSLRSVGYGLIQASSGRV